MQIPESDYATINRALIEIDRVYEISETFGQDIEQKVRFICEDACQRPEFWEGGFNMDAGLAAVVRYLNQHYPWLSERAVWMVRHQCFMEHK
jgi:hypothetical protein